MLLSSTWFQFSYCSPMVTASKLCRRLKELGIPFVVHSGYSAVEGACRDAVFVAKPENPEALVATIEGPGTTQLHTEVGITDDWQSG